MIILPSVSAGIFRDADGRARFVFDVERKDAVLTGKCLPAAGGAPMRK
ncbi:hypothetical protein [Bradyrhizobium sp. 2S1]|nr:hypothetical protein [Bradyrhizobium sp. 2S1]MCK7671221.1 hypothetical protein [Bradyrhizobium sp. 2S1]